MTTGVGQGMGGERRGPRGGGGRQEVGFAFRLVPMDVENEDLEFFSQDGPALFADGTATVAVADAPLALYRRYRPEVFSEVIGQEHVTEPLKRALSHNRVNHAYLFSGPRGCGKTSSARILARSLNCEQGPTATPCGTCQSCRDLARGGPGSIDVIEIDAASHGGVDDARDLRERAFFAPVHSRYKIYIVDEAHMVTAAGFNALLKLVEEPPPHVKFIFATTEPDKVIGTIRSRTHHYPFRLIPPKTMTSFLTQICEEEHVHTEPGVIAMVVRAGGGSVRDSLSILDQLFGGAKDSGVGYAQAASLLGYTPDSLLDDVVDALADNNSRQVFASIDKVIETGQDPRRFTEDLLTRLRDLVIVAAVPDALSTGLLDVPDDQGERYTTQATKIGVGNLTRAAEVLAAGLVAMRGTTTPRLQLELMCARILLPTSDAGERGLHARLERLERRLDMGAVPAGPASTVAAPPVDAIAGGVTRHNAAGVRPEATHPGGYGGQGTPGPGTSSSGSSTSVPGLAAPAQSSPVTSGWDASEQRLATSGPAASGQGTSRQGESGPSASGPGTSGPGTAGQGLATSSWDTSVPGTSRPSTSGPGTSESSMSGPGLSGPAQSGPGASGWGASGSSASGPGTSGLTQSSPGTSSWGTSGPPTSGPAQAGTPPVPGTPPTTDQSPAQLSTDDIRRSWPRILGRVSAARRYLWMILNQYATVTELSGAPGQAYALWLTFKDPGSRDNFNQSGGEEVVAQAVQAELGVTVAVRARLESEPIPPAGRTAILSLAKPAGTPAAPAHPSPPAHSAPARTTAEPLFEATTETDPPESEPTMRSEGDISGTLDVPDAPHHQVSQDDSPRVDSQTPEATDVPPTDPPEVTPTEPSPKPPAPPRKRPAKPAPPSVLDDEPDPEADDIVEAPDDQAQELVMELFAAELVKEEQTKPRPRTRKNP